MIEKKILDACCGSRMFWFDKGNPNVVFADIRKETHVLCDGRELDINPDIEIDFRAMPFEKKSFSLVVFDPPHLKSAGKNSWMSKKYGVLNKDTWRADLKKGFTESFRVLRDDGFLIFKWSEDQIKVSEVLDLTPHKPLFGHKSGKRGRTHWICFMKSTKVKK